LNGISKIDPAKEEGRLRARVTAPLWFPTGKTSDCRLWPVAFIHLLACVVENLFIVAVYNRYGKHVIKLGKPLGKKPK
jgi:hypothetical protein